MAISEQIIFDALTTVNKIKHSKIYIIFTWKQRKNQYLTVYIHTQLILLNMHQGILTSP